MASMSACIVSPVIVLKLIISPFMTNVVFGILKSPERRISILRFSLMLILAILIFLWLVIVMVKRTFSLVFKVFMVMFLKFRAIMLRFLIISSKLSSYSKVFLLKFVKSMVILLSNSCLLFLLKKAGKPLDSSLVMKNPLRILLRR